MSSIKVLIVDDHALLRRGLATLLAFDPGLEVVGDAKNGDEAISQAQHLQPDVIVMDLSMPVIDGVEATRRIHESNPAIKILILTSYGTSVDVTRAIEAGASGALVKDADDDQLVSAIRTVAAGGEAFSPEIRTMLKNEPHPPSLTERQLEILKHTINGLSSDEISARLSISTYAVNQHLDTIRKKLGAANRTEAVAIALRKHLLKI